MTVENSEKKSDRIGAIVCLLFVLIGIILIGMRSYNAFTMKDGENCTVYINPDKPDCPKTTNYALGIIFFVAGGVVFMATQKDNKKNRKEMI